MKYMSQAYSKLVFFSMFMAIGNVNAEPIRLDSSQFQESFAENVNISGSMRAGVMYSSSLSHVAPSSLYIDIEAQPNQILCVKMISMDGQYSASINYRLPKSIIGRTQFLLPTKWKDVVTTYSPRELAVLAEIKSSDKLDSIKLTCKKKGGRIVPASWGEPSKLDFLKVYLNSGVSKTYLILTKNSGGKTKLSCKSIQTDRNTAYDIGCSISDVGRYKLEKTVMKSINYGSQSDPIKLKISILKGLQ